MGDYNDFDGAPLSLHKLELHRLLSCDFQRMALECLYLAYMGNTLTDRPAAIFHMICNFECYDIRFEDIMQLGNSELPQLDEFLVQWIAYLGKQTVRHAERLLCEAQAMLRDEAMQLEEARKYAVSHPSLYKQLLAMKQDSGEDEKMLQIGMEALDQLPRPYVIRSEVALLTAAYACKLRNKATAEACWLEAFRSNSTVVNYLRIRLRAEDWGKYADEVKRIYEQAYKETVEKRSPSNIQYDLNRQRENKLEKNEYYFLLFLEKQFTKVFQIGMNGKKALGWSSAFMKQGLALFLLLLYNGKDLPIGLQTMLHMAASACQFEAAKYFQGTEASEDTNDSDTFWKLLCLWKEDILISEHQQKEWLDKIDKWIASRVEGIMSRNYRNSYGECAAYIAALGEVQESAGIQRAKAHIMEKYRSEYSRRWAFHQELRRYGMIR